MTTVKAVVMRRGLAGAMACAARRHAGRLDAIHAERAPADTVPEADRQPWAPIAR
jgi:hypothetical protein